MPGAGSLATRLTKPLCRRGKIELEAEYLARRRQHGSKTDKTFMQKGKNWRQNILPGAGSMATRLIKPLCRRGKIELEAKYFAWRQQHGSQTDQTFMQERKNWRQKYLA